MPNRYFQAFRYSFPTDVLCQLVLTTRLTIKWSRERQERYRRAAPSRVFVFVIPLFLLPLLRSLRAGSRGKEFSSTGRIADTRPTSFAVVIACCVSLFLCFVCLFPNALSTA